MGLQCFVSKKEIIIDAAGWSDLLLGVVVGAIKPPNPMLMERRIPTSSFQSPNFEAKKYLSDAVRIADEIIDVMKPDHETCFKVSGSYVLSGLRMHLQNSGYNVLKVEDTGELKGMVERGYLRWCAKEGVPQQVLGEKNRFWAFLDWVAERPQLREGLVKTGWASWQRKWKEEIYKKSRLAKNSAA
ncbi:MAG: hypothetical protein N3D85_07250 [Candidatus Bathyarchaeota archaeon]|nr:hypothetical protein [Candidatus Bathyarchaeota archaeon]